MTQTNGSAPKSVYNQRALTIGFGVFALLEAIAVVWVVHIAAGRLWVTLAVAGAFAGVITASFIYAARRHREDHPQEDPAGQAAAPIVAQPDGTRPWSRPAAPGTMKLVTVEGVEVLVGDHKILDVEQLDVREGEMVVLAGRNGSGKTTLLRAIGSLIPYRGEISVHGGIGFMPDRPALYPRLTGVEHVALVMAMRGVSRDSRKAAAQDFLSRFDLADVGDRRVRGWSLGMRRKLTLALALCGQPRVLLLDEPGDALDDVAFGELGRLLHEHLERGGAAIVASHDHRIAHAAHRVVEIDKGRIRGGPRSLVTFSQALIATALASGSVGLVNLLHKVLDPFVALVAATKPDSPATAWSLRCAAEASGLAAITVVIGAAFFGGQDGLWGAALGAPLGALRTLLLGGLGARLYVALAICRTDARMAFFMQRLWPRAGPGADLRALPREAPGGWDRSVLTSDSQFFIVYGLHFSRSGSSLAYWGHQQSSPCIPLLSNEGGTGQRQPRCRPISPRHSILRMRMSAP